jgi:hypothetical protein
LALFLQLVSEPFCRFRVRKDAVVSNVFEVEPGLVLLSNISHILITCRQEVQKKAGCMYYMLKIPCECSLLANDFQISPRLSACHNLKDDDDAMVYPVNIAVLQQFFNTSEIAHIMASSVFKDPVKYSVPDMQIAENRFQQDLAEGSKLDADL